VVCIGVGFMLALVLRERFGGSTAQEDPCYGQGEIVNTWKHEVTQEEVDSLKASRPDLADMEAGVVEYRQCRWGPGYEVIIDEKGHLFSFRQPTMAELESYYKEHPEENPQNQIATAQAESKVDQFVTPPLPTAAALADTILAGCDPAWQERDFPQIKLRLCYPLDWAVEDEDPSRNDAPVVISNATISMLFSPRGTGEVPMDCVEPAVIETASGDARLCAWRPSVGAEGRGYQVGLPIRHRVNILSREPDFLTEEPNQENLALALRIALAAEELP
jgi:hypothetical protein